MRSRVPFGVALVLCASCARSSSDGTGSSAASATEDAGIPVFEVVAVIAQRLDTKRRLPAEIYAYESVALYPRVSGFVEEVSVDRGDSVRQGQLLARLTAPELLAQRAEAESKAAAARSTYMRTKAAAETPGVIAKNDLETAAAAFRSELSRLEALKTLEGYLWVRAPFDGIVTERNVHPGALVGPPAGGAAPMLRMESISHLRVTVAVPERDVGAIAEGASVEFSVRTWPGMTFSGVIRRLAHAVDMRTRTMPVELDYVNEDGKLAPGMYAEVIWPVRRETPSLFVPSSAIVQTPSEVYVNRVKDGTVSRVPVERGMAVRDRVEVFSSGLSAGELVLKHGSEELKTGSKVQVHVAPDDEGAAQ